MKKSNKNKKLLWSPWNFLVEVLVEMADFGRKAFMGIAFLLRVFALE
jgi:hypothetical protein